MGELPPADPVPPEPTSELGKLLLDFDARLKALEGRHADLASDITALKAWVKKL